MADGISFNFLAKPILSFLAKYLHISMRQRFVLFSEIIIKAQKRGWKIPHQTSLEEIDFLDAIYQSALDNEIFIKGQEGRNDFPSLDENEPLTLIEANKWRDFKIHTNIYSTKSTPINEEIKAYNSRDNHAFRYSNLQISIPDRLWWHRIESYYKGRRDRMRSN